MSAAVPQKITDFGAVQGFPGPRGVSGPRAAAHTWESPGGGQVQALFLKPAGAHVRALGEMLGRSGHHAGLSPSRLKRLVVRPSHFALELFPHTDGDDAHGGVCAQPVTVVNSSATESRRDGVMVARKKSALARSLFG